MAEGTTDKQLDVRCPYCGVAFGIAESYAEIRRKDGSSFYCPNGHPMSYTHSTAKTMVTLQKELEHWQAEAARLLELNDKLHKKLGDLAINKGYKPNWIENIFGPTKRRKS